MSSKVQAIGAAASTLWMRAIVTAAKGALFLLLPAVLLRESTAQSSPESINPGPDIIMADIPTLNQFGSSGTQVGLGVGTVSCNAGDIELDYFAMPNTNHPVMAQNLYQISIG